MSYRASCFEPVHPDGSGRGRSEPQVDEDVATWCEIQPWPRRHGRTGQEVDIKLLNDRREDQLHLGHRESHADAASRTAAEREVRVRRSPGGSLGREPARIKTLRIGPIGGKAVDHVHADPDGRSSGDLVASKHVVLRHQHDRCPSPAGTAASILRSPCA